MRTSEHGIRAAIVLNHISHLMRFPDGSQAGHFKTCGRAYVHVSPEYLWKTFPLHEPPSGVCGLEGASRRRSHRRARI